MGDATRLYELCPTYESMSQVSRINDPWISAMSHVNESCHTLTNSFPRVPASWMSHITCQWVMSHINESCHISMSHVTYAWVMSRINDHIQMKTQYIPLYPHMSMSIHEGILGQYPLVPPYEYESTRGYTGSWLVNESHIYIYVYVHVYIYIYIHIHDSWIGATSRRASYIRVWTNDSYHTHTQ